MPNLQSRKTAICSSLLAAALNIGCAGIHSEREGTQTAVQLALDDARGAAMEIDSHVARVDANVEIALALIASGQHEEVDGVLRQALDGARQLTAPPQRAEALVSIATAWVTHGSDEVAIGLLSSEQPNLREIVDETKRWDIAGKFAAARAAAGDAAGALQDVGRMPQHSYALAAHKARTLHDIAPRQALTGDFHGAEATLDAITMGLAYYQAAARADVAVIAAHGNRRTLADQLLGEAEKTARAQDDGYFVAGALRHLGEAYAEFGEDAKAMAYFDDALDGARSAAQPQQKARAVSRVATTMADHGYYDQAGSTLPEAVRLAKSESSAPMRLWAYYEIAGAASFAGYFETARQLLEMIPVDQSFSGTPLRSATQRDVAWGLARHGNVDESLRLAKSITTPRERVQALCRIVRVLMDPNMAALPRYL